MPVIAPTLTDYLLWIIKLPKVYSYENNGVYGVIAGIGAGYALFGSPFEALEAEDWTTLAKGYAVGGAVGFGVASSLEARDPSR